MTTGPSLSNEQFAFLDLKPDVGVIVDEANQGLSLEARQYRQSFSTMSAVQNCLTPLLSCPNTK
jgi:hypothetical protein